MSIVINGTGTISGLSNAGGIASAQSGSIIQTVNATTSTETSTNTNSFVDTNLTATITPQFSTSKILVIVHQAGLEKATNNTGIVLKLLRGSTTLINIEAWAAGTNDTSLNVVGGSGCNYLDSPATTSATTYKTQFCSYGNNNIVYCQYGNAPYTSTSSITLMEIAA